MRMRAVSQATPFLLGIYLSRLSNKLAGSRIPSVLFNTLAGSRMPSVMET